MHLEYPPESISDFDTKVERLVDIFIDRQITQEEYAKRKAKLLNEKVDTPAFTGEELPLV